MKQLNEGEGGKEYFREILTNLIFISRRIADDTILKLMEVEFYYI